MGRIIFLQIVLSINILAFSCHNKADILQKKDPGQAVDWNTLPRINRLSLDSAHSIRWIKIDSNTFNLSVWKGDVPGNSIGFKGKLNRVFYKDIDNDGNPEIIFIITKPVKFDSSYQKRVNVFSLNGLSLQAKWLGTHFIDEIIQTEIVSINSTYYLKTKEKDNHENMYLRTYVWNEFGFSLYKGQTL